MTGVRNLTRSEWELLNYLVASAKNPSLQSELNEGLVVMRLSDGRMGSLRLIPRGVDSRLQQFGRQLLHADCHDIDGVPVSITVNLDKNGHLYELDIWKVDFSDLVRFPSKTHINVRPTEEDKH